ncbi:MAG: hypothetical protein IKK92_13270 [Prevotella sp.]|nr:hypothetical protein [Prevotella sp.]
MLPIRAALHGAAGTADPDCLEHATPADRRAGGEGAHPVLAHQVRGVGVVPAGTGTQGEGARG